MAILGLTHNENGDSVQRLPVAIKVSIGLGPDESAGRKYPQRLDHFTFLKKTIKNNKDVSWAEDEAVAKAMKEAYGENPREIGIILLDDSIENVFRTEYAWWKATECYCRGSLVEIEAAPSRFEMRAVRRTELHPEGEEWPGKYVYPKNHAKAGKPVEPCGDGCPDLERGDCKPSGDLHFILDRFPILGAVCRLHTTSYRSIRNISNALQQIQGITGGRLAGIRVMLKVEPERIKYEDDKGKHTSTAHILNIRMDAPSMEKLIGNMTETAKLFQATRKMLGARRIEVIEDDNDRAQEISSEFYPDDKPALPPAKEEEHSVDDQALRVEIHALCEKLGYNTAKEQMIVGQNQGKLSELRDSLASSVAEKDKSETKSAKNETKAAKSETAKEENGTKATQPETDGKKTKKQPNLSF